MGGATGVSVLPIEVTEHTGDLGGEDRARALRRARAVMSKQLQSSLRSIGLDMHATHLAECGRVYVSACGDCGGKAARSAFRCQSKLCPWCLQRRGLARAADLVPHVMAYKNPIHITLTVKNGPSLAERDKHLREAWHVLKRRVIWARGVSTGFVFWETTRNLVTGEWHPHLHIIADGWISHEDLRAEWLDITGDSSIVYVKQVAGSVEDVREVCKYPVKSDDIAGSPQAVLEYLQVTHGSRLFWTYGYKRNNWKNSPKVEVAIPEEEQLELGAAEAVEGVDPDKCPHCAAEGQMVAQYRSDESGFRRRIRWSRGDVRAVRWGWYVLDAEYEPIIQGGSSIRSPKKAANLVADGLVAGIDLR